MTAPKKRSPPKPRPTAIGRRNPRIRAMQDEIVLAHGWIVDIYVRQYRSSPAGQEDLRQEGWIGLLRAAETFDACRGFKFSTYASYWVRSYVQRAHDRCVAEVAPMNRYALEDGPDGHRHFAHHAAVRLDEPAHVGDEHETRLDTMASGVPTPEEVCAACEECDILGGIIDEACDGLDPRLVVVALERLRAPNAKTLQRVGVMLGISRERVRQLECQLLAAVRAVASVTLDPCGERRQGEPRRRTVRA